MGCVCSALSNSVTFLRVRFVMGFGQIETWILCERSQGCFHLRESWQIGDVDAVALEMKSLNSGGTKAPKTEALVL